MPKLLKIKIPLIVCADGKWAVIASHREADAPDWQAADEHCDYDNPTIMPTRYIVETAVELPEEKAVPGVAIPERA